MKDIIENQINIIDKLIIDLSDESGSDKILNKMYDVRYRMKTFWKKADFVDASNDYTCFIFDLGQLAGTLLYYKSNKFKITKEHMKELNHIYKKYQ